MHFRKIAIYTSITAIILFPAPSVAQEEQPLPSHTVAPGATTKPPIVESAVPNEKLSATFVNLSGWTGGDAAYSIPLSKSRSLWTFGDSFIGRISNGVRSELSMVHNSAAWVDSRNNGSYKATFFWRQRASKPASLIDPSAPLKAYYWPGGMASLGSKLALFCKVVVDKPANDSGFGFDWFDQELVLVEDAATTMPSDWKYTRHKLPGGELSIMPGAGCMIVDDFVYVYSTRKDNPNPHNCVLMRIRASELAKPDVSKFEYWVHKHTSDGRPLEDGEWSQEPLYPMTLFNRAAPEMSVSPVAGLPGYFAVYTEHGLGANIMMRHALKPEGPWSEPVLLYQAPEAVRNPKLLCYGAKHHPELATADRTLVITYCLNPGPLAAHRTQPMLYFPRAVTVTLKPSP